MNIKIINLRRRGFTLIELLVVISIISILSSVVLTSLKSARSKADDSKFRAEIHSLAVALEIYYDKYGVYPASEPNCGGQSADAWCRDTQGSNWIPGLSEFLPTMPHNTSPAQPGWVYHYFGNANQYWLMTKMKNLAKDTCGGGAVYIWLNGPSGDWCSWDPINHYSVYVVSKR